MNPLKVSAQFVAFVWYSETKGGAVTRDEAARFARENWVTFLPSAHEGWGKLLLRVAKLPRAGGRRGRRSRTERAAHGPIQRMAEAG
jgi:hypothetical protein